MKRIMKYLRPCLFRMSVGLTIKFLGSITDLLLPWILAYIIDNVIPLKSVRSILFWGAVMIVCSVFALIGNIVPNRMAARVARDATRLIRHDLFSKISYLSCRQIDKATIPSLMSRLTSDTYNIHRMLSMMQRMGVRAPILLIGGIMVTLTLDPALTLVLVSVLPFITLVVFLVSRKGIPMYTRLQQSVDALVRTVRENAAGIRVIKALSKTEYEKARFAKVNGEVMDKEKKAGITMATTNPMMNLFLNVGLTLVVIVGAYRVNSGITQPGKIIAFLSYFTLILNAMLAITRLFVMFSQGSASAGRISEILALPDDIAVMERDHIDNGYHIAFENVSFSYGGEKRKSHVNNINFKLKKGEKLGIIGATGCGKSTVIQLLLRLYDVDEGIIRVNGDDIRGIPPEKLHTMFGITFQNDVLFADTISENIDFGRDLDDLKITNAVEFAQAGEFVNSLDEGFDYRLTSKGTNLSGGQKQRLLIARALAAKPEILILDDSSSALDYKTDALLRKALHDNFEKTTTIIIAQRISSIMYADRVIVMEDGMILGCGTHDELMESCETYNEISRSQMGLEDGEYA